MNLFETSTQLISQITRLDQIIIQLEAEISDLRDIKTIMQGQFDSNESTILRLPLCNMNNKLRVANKCLKWEIIRCREKITRFEQKLDKNKFMRTAKLTHFSDPLINSKGFEDPSHATGIVHFEWDQVLKNDN